MAIKKPSRAALTTAVLLMGFTCAVIVRSLVGGPGVAQSALAGLVFAGYLFALGLAAGTKFSISRRATLIGVLGGLALCTPAILVRIAHQGSAISSSGYATWAVVVTLVAVAEEYFLRGALFDAADTWLGPAAAVLICACAFTLLHIPLYGWHIVPLDLAVGLWLGALRVVSRTWTAPAIAHTLADLLAWWLR